MDKNEDNNLTVLLTLYDRHIYTQRWIDFNWNNSFDYVIADGSLQNFNEEIILKNKKDNIKYLRYKNDTCAKDYIEKIINALGHVKTRYVMMADNDDFLVINNVKKIARELALSERFIGAHGVIGSIYEKRNKFKEPFNEPRTCEHITNVQGIEAIDICVNDYNYLHYSIIDTKIQIRIFEDLLNSGCNNFYLTENFHTFLALCYGKFLWNPKTFYIRQRDSEASNAANDLKNLYLNPLYDFILNEEYEKSYKNLCKRISEILNKKPEEIYSKIRVFYIKRYINHSELRIKSLSHKIRKLISIYKYKYNSENLKIKISRY